MLFVPVSGIEYGVYGDLTITYPSPGDYRVQCFLKGLRKLRPGGVNLRCLDSE